MGQVLNDPLTAAMEQIVKRLPEMNAGELTLATRLLLDYKIMQLDYKTPEQEEGVPTMLDRVEAIRKVHAVHGSDGNWNASEYMLGLFNGLELALSLLDGREVTYRGKSGLREQPKAPSDIAEPPRREDQGFVPPYNTRREETPFDKQMVLDRQGQYNTMGAVLHAEVSGIRGEDMRYTRGYNTGLKEKAEEHAAELEAYAARNTELRNALIDTEQQRDLAIIEIGTLKRENDTYTSLNGLMATERDDALTERDAMREVIKQMDGERMLLREQIKNLGCALTSVSAHRMLDIMQHKTVMLRIVHAGEHSRVVEFSPEKIILTDGKLAIVGTQNVSMSKAFYTADTIDGFDPKA